ncbi:uncharacterized protein N7459_009925 [Penicillium hispanicum]|uniref:uncharacterized protein n=1 Tax=Penicillium hispanicum TaxID=1080232 RepID=UPI002540A12C|nr:uncharacterized protein N7459_009925 [Penicillium hispanicum]KAJ5570495.1 hypothetical protein N7459_009925 [Penicillium hispanicum]
MEEATRIIYSNVSRLARLYSAPTGSKTDSQRNAIESTVAVTNTIPPTRRNRHCSSNYACIGQHSPAYTMSLSVHMRCIARANAGPRACVSGLRDPRLRSPGGIFGRDSMRSAEENLGSWWSGVQERKEQDRNLGRNQRPGRVGRGNNVPVGKVSHDHATGHPCLRDQGNVLADEYAACMDGGSGACWTSLQRRRLAETRTPDIAIRDSAADTHPHRR